MKGKPLISFILSCFNQEAFIREAVESAFAQTYSSLEIIISDDCSADRTFEIIQQMAAEYKGPHSLKLNRNSTNLGIGANVNRAAALCKGELILVAAGDDLSLPERTELMYQIWEERGRPTSICSSYTTISGDGSELGNGGFRGDPNDTRPVLSLKGDLFDFFSTRKPAVCGCSHAWTPALFNFFGPLTSDLEDLVISFRSLAISEIIYIRKPLVKYRRHGSNVSFFAGGDDTVSFTHRERRLLWVNEQTKRAYDNMLADLEVLYAKGRMNAAQRDRLKREAQRVRNIYAAELQMMQGDFSKKLRVLAGALTEGNFEALRFAPRLLPLLIYRGLYLSVCKARKLFRSEP